MARFRLLRPIAASRISGAVAATGDLSAETGGGGPSVLSNPVTTALDATGSGTRYDVTNDTELRAVPFGALTAGSVVNIFYSATPYSTKIGLRGQGTSTDPIVINGVTDASGNRPKINGEGATTAAGSNPSGGYGGANDTFSSTPDYGEGLGLIVVKRGPNDGYATYSPRHIHVKNLEVYGGYTTSYTSYTTLAGGTASHSAGGAGIYLLLLKDGLIENCVIHDNSFGVFMQAKDGVLSEACERITVRNCRVYNNGVVGSFFEHNFYVQCRQPVIEGNFIGIVKSGSEGSSYKSRSSGEIFRYNYVEGSARVIDFVHSEDQATDGIVTLPEYGTDYVYGNLLVNDASLGNYAGNMIHLGGDNLGEDDTGAFTNPSLKYRQRMYFFHNTVVFRGQNSSSPYRGAIFDLSLAANNPNTSKGAPSTVESWNNIYVYTGVLGAPTEPGWMEYAGVVNHYGNNIAFGTFQDARSDALTGRAVLNNAGTLITADPAFTNLAGHDYSLASGSSARGQASSPTAVSSVTAAHPVQYQPRMAANGLVARSSTNDIGACEYGVS